MVFYALTSRLILFRVLKVKLEPLIQANIAFYSEGYCKLSKFHFGMHKFLYRATKKPAKRGLF